MYSECFLSDLEPLQNVNDSTDASQELLSIIALSALTLNNKIQMLTDF